jgi:dTMP kinase
MASDKGLFITFEGGEGSGKSTQLQLLKARLEAAGRRVVQMREPGATPMGEELRQLLLTSKNIAPRTEMLLFEAARAELVQKLIKPALNGGIDVVCDRFIDSTTAYQGYGLGIEMDIITHLNTHVIDGCVPDLTVLLDIDPEAGLARASEGSAGDAIEGHWQKGLAFEAEVPDASGSAGKRQGGRNQAFHRKVRQGYLELAQAEPERFLVLDARLPKEELSRSIWQRLQALIAARQAG